MHSTKTAQYHDVTNDTPSLTFNWYFPSNAPEQLSSTVLQITGVLAFFCGIFNEIQQHRSVPWCYKWQALSDPDISHYSTKTAQYHGSTKKAQYHDATNDKHFFHVTSHASHQIILMPWCYGGQSFCHILIVFPIKFATASQDQDATNGGRSLIFSFFFPWIHQNNSAPRCWK